MLALREIVESPNVARDQLRFAEAQRSLATIYGLQGAWESNLAARNAAAMAFESAGLSGEAAIERLAAAARNTGMNNLKRAIELCDMAIALAQKKDRRDIKARALGLKGNILSMQGQAEAGIQIANEGLALALDNNLPEAASEVYRRLGSTLEYASQYKSSQEVYDNAYRYCTAQGDEANSEICLSCMSWVLFRTGDWKRCLEVCKEVIGNEEKNPGPAAVAYGVAGLIRAYRGEARQARRYFEKSLPQIRRNAHVVMEMIVLWGLALLETFDGNDEAAAPLYNKVLELRDQEQDMHDSLLAICSAVTFFGTRGAQQETAMCVKALADMSAETGNIETLGALAIALGETALLNQRPADAVRQFQQALTHFETLETPLEIAQIEYRLGVALNNKNEKEAAIHHYKNGYRLARNLGVRPLAAQISDELQRLGETAEERRTPEAQERINQGGLTRRQVEIARLIADGLTNKEIASKLFLSPRTVEMHVANMLDRLDCRSRSEVVRKAGELGLLN